ncbi:MAG: hypothetical protein D6744_10620 [Planctomycetota bacterium]|nr:MAG: hypothetical protein D6744_10620 [Planctomycetota bacterium]
MRSEVRILAGPIDAPHASIARAKPFTDSAEVSLTQVAEREPPLCVGCESGRRIGGGEDAAGERGRHAQAMTSSGYDRCNCRGFNKLDRPEVAARYNQNVKRSGRVGAGPCVFPSPM